MAIIVEGPDNSGKTTFVNWLSDRLKMPAFHAGGPPETNDYALKLCREQSMFNTQSVILDRITPISRQIYENRFKDPELMDYLKNIVDYPYSVIVYCRPPNEVLMDMSNHEVKSHDTVEHIAYVMENQHNFIELYDRLMVEVPHIHYDWTSDIDKEFLAKMLYRIQFDKNYAIENTRLIPR